MALTGCFKAKVKDSRKTRQETTEGLNDKIKHRVRRGEKKTSVQAWSVHLGYAVYF